MLQKSFLRVKVLWVEKIGHLENWKKMLKVKRPLEAVPQT